MRTVRDWIDRVSGGYPPRGFRLEDYQRWFPKTGDVFLRRLKRSDALSVPTGQGRPVGVVVGPWISTPTPWYAIELAIGLARRGREVVLLWDDTGFPEARVDDQNATIGRVLDHVGRYLEVVRISAHDPAPGREGDDELLDTLTAANVMWQQRGAPDNPRGERYGARVRDALARSLPRVRTAVGSRGLEYLVVAGGVYGTSGIFRQVGAESGCRVATYDADLNVAQICVDGVAAQSQDVPTAFAALSGRPETERRQAITIGRGEFLHRVEQRDRYGFQAVPATGGDPGVTEPTDVLIPLNIEWDTAALGRHVHFADTPEWLGETIAVILEQGDHTVTVRRHPSERRQAQASRMDLAATLHDRFGDDPRLRVIAPDDPVSTYDLLGSARLVLPFVSTIAIEAAGMGKPVLVSGTSYYSDLGFVWSAGSRAEYLALLRRGLDGDLPLLPDQVDRAWLCYYLAAVRNRVWTDFTSQPSDFWAWCRRDSDVLLAEPDVSDILQAIDSGEPVSLVRHRTRPIPTAA